MLENHHGGNHKLVSHRDGCQPVRRLSITQFSCACASALRQARMPPRTAGWSRAGEKMDLVFIPPTPKGCECRGNGKCPMQTAAHPSTGSRDAALCPPPCPGKLLFGTGPGACCCHDTSGPAASISIEVFPELWSNSEVQVAQALSLLWETPCSCSGPRAHCCALDTTSLTSFASMRMGRKAVDASVSSRQKVCNIKCRLLASQQSKGFHRILE